MRALIVTETFYPSVDGVVTRLTEAIRYLTRLGHEIAVVAPDLGEQNFEGVPIYGVPAHRLPWYRSRPWGRPSTLVRDAIDDFMPDVVHVANPILIGTSGIKYACDRDLPLVVSYHTNLEKYFKYYHLDNRWTRKAYWQFIRHFHNKADINLCTSQSTRRMLEVNGIERVNVLKRGVDVTKRHPRFASSEMRRILTNGHSEAFLLVYVGRMAAEKDLGSLRSLLDRAPNVHLALIGDGPARKSLQHIFAGTNTVFTGYLQGDVLSSAYASADAFIFPSVTETLGLVLLEAMASGLPILAARSGPTEEQVNHGQNGFLFDTGDNDALLGAIQALKDPERRRHMSEQARQTSERYRWSITSQQLLDYYHLAVARDQRQKRGR